MGSVVGLDWMCTALGDHSVIMGFHLLFFSGLVSEMPWFMSFDLDGC